MDLTNLLCYNAKTAFMQTLNIKRNEEEFSKVLEQKDEFKNRSFDLVCENSEVEINIDQLKSFQNIQFLDVREAFERPKPDLENVIQIPLREINRRIKELPKDKTLVVFCQSGLRSKKAVDYLRKINLKKSYSLRQGAHALMDINIEI